MAAYLSDFTNTADWDPHTKECQRLASGPLQVGANYRSVQKVAGRSSELRYALVEYRPEEKVQLKGDGDNVKATDTLFFAATQDGGTKVTYRAEFVFSGPSRIVQPLLKVMLNKVGDDGAEGMQRALDRLVPHGSATSEAVAATQPKPDGVAGTA